MSLTINVIGYDIKKWFDDKDVGFMVISEISERNPASSLSHRTFRFLGAPVFSEWLSG